jgi:methionine-rich copper-binding protein CopC
MVAAALCATLGGCAPSLAVAPQLIAAWPMDGAHLAVARYFFELTFNRPLDLQSTWAVVSGDDGTTLKADVSLDPRASQRLKVHLLEPTPGEFELHWHVAAADSHLVSEGAEGFVLLREASAPARIDVAPDVANANDRLELVGKGFVRNASVQLTIGDDDQSLGSTQTDASGKFNLEAHVPAGEPYGVQRISVFEGQRRAATGAVQVHWGGWPPLVASNLGQPGPGASEVTFSLSVFNRSDYVLEHVRVVMKDPDDATLVDADRGAQRADGALEWDIPMLDRGVYGPLHVTYRVAHPVVSHAWFEFRHRHERSCDGNECQPAFISTSVADSTPVAPADSSSGAPDMMTWL